MTPSGSSRLVRALGEVGGIDPRLRPPDTAVRSAPGAAELLARLLDALPGGQPVQLVLDDVHAVHEAGALGVLRSLAGEWPARSRLVLVSAHRARRLRRPAPCLA